MNITFERTNRGFMEISFDDLYGNLCTLQKSSLASEECIWLGTGPDRMHLNQEQVKTLLPLLKHFVKTGELPDST